MNNSLVAYSSSSSDAEESDFGKNVTSIIQYNTANSAISKSTTTDSKITTIKRAAIHQEEDDEEIKSPKDNNNIKKKLKMDDHQNDHDSKNHEDNAFDFFGLDNQDEEKEQDNNQKQKDSSPDRNDDDDDDDPSLSYEAYAAQFNSHALISNHQQVSTSISSSRTTTTYSNNNQSMNNSSSHLNQEDYDSFNHIPEFNADKRSHGNNINIKNVTTDDLMSDMWKYAATRDALLEAESSRAPNKFQGAKTSSGRRRNNNIMYLAFKAQEQRKALEEEAAHRKIERKETKSKYGF